MENETCPCKRVKCERHGDCAACKEHHSSQKKCPTACERAARKEERKNLKTQRHYRGKEI
mgnify:FL=1